jgi:hypothetical protein
MAARRMVNTETCPFKRLDKPAGLDGRQTGHAMSAGT